MIIRLLVVWTDDVLIESKYIFNSNVTLGSDLYKY